MLLLVHIQVRATSHKPDEIYGIIERLVPGSRKIELFGRPHNVQPNWQVSFKMKGWIRKGEGGRGEAHVRGVT